MIDDDVDPLTVRVADVLGAHIQRTVTCNHGDVVLRRLLSLSGHPFWGAVLPSGRPAVLPMITGYEDIVVGMDRNFYYAPDEWNKATKKAHGWPDKEQA